MDSLPPNALVHLPVLVAEAREHFPVVPAHFFAAQVEQETCPSLRSKKCWSPRAELRTSREYGFGLGQLTVTSRFDNFKEAKKLDTSLKSWAWEDRYNATYQLRTMVLMDRQSWARLSMVPKFCDRLAMSLSAYNGGLGGLLNDRRLCANTEGCDPGRWFDNVEKTSFKKKTKTSGYGKSFFEINREYVFNILRVRFEKYQIAALYSDENKSSKNSE